MFELLEKHVKEHPIYAEQRFRDAYEEVLKKDNGVWGQIPKDFDIDIKGKCK